MEDTLTRWSLEPELQHSNLDRVFFHCRFHYHCRSRSYLLLIPRCQFSRCTMQVSSRNAILLLHSDRFGLHM